MIEFASRLPYNVVGVGDSRLPVPIVNTRHPRDCQPLVFDWLQRVFHQIRDEPRRHIFDLVDALNAESSGGRPRSETKALGRLKIASGTMVLGDPQSMPGLEIPNVAADEVSISASLWQYPDGSQTIRSLTLGFGEPTGNGPHRRIGEIAIDSAKLVVADKDDFHKHWTVVGKDRIGEISTAPDETLLRTLTKHFKLKTVPINPIKARIVGQVSERLEGEITAFLKADPRYAAYPFLHFRVRTNNSFERANSLAKGWAFIPVGNTDTPSMFVCGTGHGDGRYPVQGEFAGERIRVVSVSFIEDEDES